jgi:hypothetical protein
MRAAHLFQFLYFQALFDAGAIVSEIMVMSDFAQPEILNNVVIKYL